jgi:two-component sensor histidine kinase
LGDVQLRPYFIQLCQSLGASMIHDPTRLSIDVKVDDSVVDANVSVSLGPMVTELVINALKHAFLYDNRGRIVVAYHADGEDWTLSVTDDGIGMPKDPELAKPGLGTASSRPWQSSFRPMCRFPTSTPVPRCRSSTWISSP